MCVRVCASSACDYLVNSSEHDGEQFQVGGCVPSW